MSAAWHLPAIVGVTVLTAGLTGVDPFVAVGLGVAAGVAAVGVRVVLGILRVVKRERVAMNEVVRQAAADLTRTSRDASTRADQVEALVGAGRLDDALTYAAPLVADARGSNPGWGVGEAACRATLDLVRAYAAAGDEQAVANQLEVLAELVGRRDLGVATSITALAKLRVVIDALLARAWHRPAVAALDVVVVAHRRSPELHAIRDSAVTSVLSALLEAGEVDAARDIHRRHVKGARPPVQVDPAVAARLQSSAHDL